MAQRQPKALLAARAVLDAQIAEADLQKNIIEYASLHGWLWWHDNDSRRNEAGLPDLILCRPPRLIIGELKTQRGRVRRAQWVWLTALSGCPQVETVIWRPAHWSSGAIEEALR